MMHGFPGWFPRTPGLRRQVRNDLRRLVCWGLRWRSQPYPVTDDTRLLIVAPHQDDSTLGCGGLMLLRRLEGAPVSVVYLTDGAASHPGHPSLTLSLLVQMRREEAEAATALLGVDHAQLTFLNEPDGTLDKLTPERRAELIERMAAVFRRAAPDQVLLPYRKDGSSEHEAGFGVVLAALAAAGLKPRVFEYPVWAWWNPLRMLRPLLRSRRIWRVDHFGYEPLKAAAVAAYRSQTQPMPPWPEAVLSPEFVEAFTPSIEYFFELDPL
jgi:LmbE family N-acetylglucosaminyl deacetylase